MYLTHTPDEVLDNITELRFLTRHRISAADARTIAKSHSDAVTAAAEKAVATDALFARLSAADVEMVALSAEDATLIIDAMEALQ